MMFLSSLYAACWFEDTGMGYSCGPEDMRQNAMVRETCLLLSIP